MLLSLDKGVFHKLTTKWKRQKIQPEKHAGSRFLPERVRARRLFLALWLQQNGFPWSPLSHILSVRQYSSSAGQTSLLLSRCQIGIRASPGLLLRLQPSNHPSLAYLICHPTSRDSHFCSLRALAPSLQPALPRLPLHLASRTCEQLPRSG